MQTNINKTNTTIDKHEKTHIEKIKQRKKQHKQNKTKQKHNNKTTTTK